MISQEEEKDIKEILEIISKLGTEKRAMASGYLSALNDVEMIEKQKAAG